MKHTSDQLRDLADEQLNIALRKRARKRALHKSDTDTEASQPQFKARRLNGLECEKRLERSERGSAEMLATFSAPAGSTTTHTTNLDIVPDQQQALQNSTDQISALDLVEDFDAPLMQIMSGVPLLVGPWEVEAQHGGAISGNDASAY